ncbi:hypothetical protein C8R44DRAFT_806037 [Mycena epipterygia]|nr:hypothetical protein C8R44DRAFT_806037 [Mycena epipterygia]
MCTNSGTLYQNRQCSTHHSDIVPHLSSVYMAYNLDTSTSGHFFLLSLLELWMSSSHSETDTALRTPPTNAPATPIVNQSGTGFFSADPTQGSNTTITTPFPSNSAPSSALNNSSSVQTPTSSNESNQGVISTSGLSNEHPLIAAASSRKPVPVAAIVGSVVATFAVLFVCVAALLIRRRRRSCRNEAPRPLWATTEPALLQPADENGINIRPDPFIHSDKRIHPQVEQPRGSSSLPPESGATSVLPTPAEQALATMAEEIRLLRGQFQRLEFERNLSGIEGAEEQPPEYATG